MRLPTGRALTLRRPSQKQADRCGGPTEARAAGLQGSLHREAFAEPSHVTHPLASRIKGSAPQPPRAASLGGGPKGRRSLGKPAHLLRFKRREQIQEAGGRGARKQLIGDRTEPQTVLRSPDPWAAPVRGLELTPPPAQGARRGTGPGTPRPASLSPSPVPLRV